jgi:hypothetical protein
VCEEEKDEGGAGGRGGEGICKKDIKRDVEATYKTIETEEQGKQRKGKEKERERSREDGGDV